MVVLVNFQFQVQLSESFWISLLLEFSFGGDVDTSLAGVV
jgi:hypothetical protein